MKKEQTAIANTLAKAFGVSASAAVVPVSMFQQAGLLSTLPSAPAPKVAFTAETAASICKEFVKCAKNRAIYNAEKPFVLVDKSFDVPTRGDMNGYVGLATRLAKKIGAKLKIIDHHSLIELTPEVQVPEGEEKYGGVDKRRAALFAKEGYPDFFFTRMLFGSVDSMSAKASGLIISIVNESLPLAVIPDFRNRTTSPATIPHHLTPEVLAFEGMRFAEEYAELPRPFIGINLIDPLYHKPDLISKKLGELVAAYEEATFFVVTCHRTAEAGYRQFMTHLRGEFAEMGDKFPIVEFDFNMHRSIYASEDYWNPYKGMLDQADHIIQCGYSGSMIAEILATGKVPHTTDLDEYWTDKCVEKGHMKRLFNHEAGTPLETPRIAPADLTGECADHLLRSLIEHKKIHNSKAMREAIKNERPADGDWTRYSNHKRPYRNIGTS